MKKLVLNVVFLAALSLLGTGQLSAQTPFEFAVVEELVGGTPFISVIRIQLNPGVPEPGRTQLEITTRAGMMLQGEQDLYPDSSSEDQVRFSGLVEFSAEIPTYKVERVFQVLSDCLDRFPGTGVTDLALDVVDVNDMSWISIECPVSRVDSVLSGCMTHEQFWRVADLQEFEVGSAVFPTYMRRPLVPQWTTLPEEEPETVTEPAGRTSQPIKSLILPGWGQLASGRGTGWINLAVEAGGIALIATGNDEAGIGVLGANHLISFVDLF